MTTTQNTATAGASLHASGTHSLSASVVTNGHGQSMDAGRGEYTQPDQSAAAYHAPQQDVKFNPLATPNSSDYSSLNPSSARSGTFPDYVHRASYGDASHRYNPSAPGAAVSNMAQPQNPSIAASSPSYPPQSHHYSPYAGHHDMGYAQPHMYPRPEYGGYPPHGLAPQYGHVASSGGHPMSTVYSFVPIPGTHQQKRPRRRYEEIERMYKCGWNGCEKAYGTLNHLNAHVTMQSHGAKRTPEEFKEIRKEWKARKKEEDNARKADEERQRQAVQQGQPLDSHGSVPEGAPPPHHPASNGYSAGVRQLPPLGYAPASGQVPQYTQAGTPAMDGMTAPYSSGPAMQPYGYPPSPYAPQGQQMYHASQPNSHVQ